MTLDQVKHCRTSIDLTKNTMIDIYDDSGTMISTYTGFVCWNDTKELLVCIRINNDHNTQILAPFSVFVLSYDRITSIVCKLK